MDDRFKFSAIANGFVKEKMSTVQRVYKISRKEMVQFNTNHLAQRID